SFGRRYSEPCNMPKDLSGAFTQQGAVDGDELSPSAPRTDSYQWQSNQGLSQDSANSLTNPNLPVKAEEMPLSKSLHPLDASVSEASDYEQSNNLLPAYVPSSSHIPATPAL
ncbi:hypothetical protein BGX24_004967, partial [Mortierella sp. AD032]